MKLNPLILLAAAGAGFYFFRNQIRSAQNLTFQLDTIGLTSVDSRGIKGYIKIKLFNPDKGVITLRQIAGTISAEGANAVNFSSTNGATLQPNTTTTAIVNFEISIANLAFSAIPIIRKIVNGEALSFLVNGFIDTNVGRVNFNKTFNTRRQ
jgi:hypothetical protein